MGVLLPTPRLGPGEMITDFRKALDTVAKELGHGGDALVKRVYGHLGTVRNRSEAVEYRVEQHEMQLRDRLKLIKSA